jgi:intracellular sulfur oxidation DsrE/DsrF family protein
MRRPFLLLAAALSAVPLFAAADDKPKAARVVFQITDADPARWSLVLNNVKNLLEALGADKVTVEIVAYGPGIGMLELDTPVSSRIAEAVKAGVAVNACENTMRAQKLVPADMHPNVTYVPAGVVEIVKRQQQGWAYVRP